MRTGLEQTAALWPAIEQGYAWVHRAAQILENTDGNDVLVVRREYRALLADMRREQAVLGALAWVVPHFCKVTKSYWLGLFRCYETAELPRTNNDLEQCFGSVRYHERRASGRKGAAPGLVVPVTSSAIGGCDMRAPSLKLAFAGPPDLHQWTFLARHPLVEVGHLIDSGAIMKGADRRRGPSHCGEARRGLAKARSRD